MKTKICTDIPQSKKLIELGVDIKTADMDYIQFANMPKEYDCVVNIDNNEHKEDWIPAWSLSALLGILPLEIETHKQTDGHKIYYYVESYMKRMGKDIYLSTERHENLVDACVEMILKLHELKLIIIYDEIGKYNIGDKLIFVKQ